MSNDVSLNDQLLTRADVLRVTTLGLTKFKELVRTGRFPPPVQITEHRVAWRASVVQSWIDALPVGDAYQDVNQSEAA